MELFAKPGVAGIIERRIDGIDYILVQDRCKDKDSLEYGLIEIPAGKIREFENIYDCLRREVLEETGLEVECIEGEEDAIVVESKGYKVISYMPFACNQNLKGDYPIMVETFICRASGQPIASSDESKNIRWINLLDLKKILRNSKNLFYPMHIATLEKYIKSKLNI